MDVMAHAPTLADLVGVASHQEAYYDSEMWCIYIISDFLPHGAAPDRR
jgi:hypothetical protein